MHSAQLQARNNAALVKHALLAVVSCVFAIPALVIGFGDVPSCAIEYDDISFTYNTFLQVYGIVAVVTAAILCGMVLFQIGYETDWIYHIARFFVILEMLFSHVWSVVGTVLLFTTLTDCRHTAAWRFGLSMFIIHSASMAFSSTMYYVDSITPKISVVAPIF